VHTARTKMQATLLECVEDKRTPQPKRLKC
jgi:hypothetical protein